MYFVCFNNVKASISLLSLVLACSKKFGKCYSIYSGARTTWTTAGAECWIRQRRLVSIHSEEEYELVKYILRNFRYIDIGPRTVSNAFSSDSVDPNYFTHIGKFVEARFD